MSDEPILRVDDLHTHYPIRRGWLRREVGRIRAVDGVNLELRRGEALGLVGESGSGKSTVARSLIGLETPTAGRVYFDGDPTDGLSAADLRAFRRRVQLIVQDPDEAFNPRMTIGHAVAEPLRLHGMDDPDRRRDLVEDLLERVGLAASDADRYPHAFSGGEKQRIAIARALIVNPDVIIADEPISALDSRVQSDVLALLDQVRRAYDIAVILISHDLDVVRLFCDRVAVMYLGTIVERGTIDDVLRRPAHPYTRVLLDSIPSLDPSDRILPRPLTETIPDPSDPPAGCRFHTRCPEIISPADVSLDRATWEAIARFRFALQMDELPDDVRAGGAVRDHFAIPDPIDDPSVEAAVAAAEAALAGGDVAAAIERLADDLPSICETAEPARIDGRTCVRCHRYDPEVAAEPLAWSEAASVPAPD